MKSLKELYQLLYEHISNEDVVHSLCWSIATLAHYKNITEEEYMELKENFCNQRPSTEKHVEFYRHSAFRKASQSSFWWDSFSKEGTEQRIKFIKYLIDHE